MKNKRFALAKAPFIRRADSTLSTSQMMKYFVMALVPIILFAWVKNGLLPFLEVETKNFSSVLTMLYPLFLVFIGGFTSFISEFIYFKYIKKTVNPLIETGNSFAIIPGLLLGMIVSINTPLWILIIGVLFATIIGKLLFGGFGKNVFNPALVGYLFIQTAYFGVISKNGGYLNGSEAIGLDIVSGVTPLANLTANPLGHFEQLVAPYGSLMDFFIGTIPGSLAETSALLCILAAAFLIWKKVINWRIPVIYVGTVFVLTYIIGAANGHATDLWYPTFGILSGGLMFGAVFMATEPVTSPRTPNGKILYALSLGALTILFRYKSNFPEGVATSILAMNLLVIIFDNIASRLRVNPKIKQVVSIYAIFGLVLIGISAYAITSVKPAFIGESPAVKVDYVASYFDVPTMSFKYEFKIGEEEFFVLTNNAYEIQSFSNEDLDTEIIRPEVEALISSKKVRNYIVEETIEGDNLILEIKTQGYATTLTSTVTISKTSKQIISLDVNASDETYDEEYNQGWNAANGHPDELIPPQIVEHQGDLSLVNPVSGATVTSNAIKKAALLANEYIEEFSELW